MGNKVFLVTGATGAIGGGIVSLLAADAANEVVMVVRDKDKAQRLIQSLNKKHKAPRLRFVLADLSSKDSICSLAELWEGPLDVLINNAAVAPKTKSLNKEGLELQFSVNVMSQLRMSEAFREKLAASAKPRIVNVASYWAGGLQLDDLQFESRVYNNDAAYRQSKQANRMLTKVLAERFAEDNITVNACHPGDVASQLSSDLGFGGSESPAQGAATPVFLAEDPRVEGVSGKYFEHLAQCPCPFMQDEDSCEELFERCVAFC